MTWNNSTLRAMEHTARGEADGTCSRVVDGKWLSVYWDDATNTYTYKLDRKKITRAEASKLHPGGLGK